MNGAGHLGVGITRLSGPTDESGCVTGAVEDRGITPGCPQDGAGCVTGDGVVGGRVRPPGCDRWIQVSQGRRQQVLGTERLGTPGGCGCHMSPGIGAVGDRDNPLGALGRLRCPLPRGGAAAERRTALGAAPATPDARLPRGCAPELPGNLQSEHPRDARERSEMRTSPHLHPKS